MLFTILRAILFVTIHETQASVCVAGDLGYMCALRDQAGGGGEGGSSPERMAMKIEDKRSGCSQNDRKDGENQEFP